MATEHRAIAAAAAAAPPPTLVEPEQEANRELAGFTPATMAVSSGEPQGQLVVPPTQRHINLFEDEETACVLTSILISGRPHPFEIRRRVDELFDCAELRQKRPNRSASG
jgi:hypothetical protein